MNVNLICVVSDKTYKTEEGKEFNQKSYYLELENGSKIAIKPSFKEDYKILALVAEKR